MKRTFLFGIILLGILSGCNGNGNGIEPVIDSAKISTNGGVYTLKNGVSLVVPAGAVDEETEIKVEYFDNITGTEINAPVPGDIQGGVKFQPEGLVFNKPIEVRMKSTLPLEEGDTTTIMLWKPEEKAFYITDFGICKNGYINFAVEHFCHYISMDNEWQMLFDLFDGYMNLYINNGNTSEAQLNEGCDLFLRKCLDEDLDFKDLKAVETFEGGGSQVACLTTCGYTGIYYYQPSSNVPTMKGEAHYKESSADVYTLHMFDQYSTSHFKEEKKNGAGVTEQVTDSTSTCGRSIYVFLKPCAFDMSGNAEKSTIKKNETTTVRFYATCDGSALPGHKVKFNYVGDIKIDKESEVTDDNGMVSVKVTGLANEGIAAVIATATSTADPSITADCQVEILLDDEKKVDRYHTDVEEIVLIGCRDTLTTHISVKTSIDWHSEDFTYVYDKITITSISQLRDVPDSVKETFNSTSNGSYDKESRLIHTNIETLSGPYNLKIQDDGFLKTITNAPIGVTVTTTDIDESETELVSSKYWRKAKSNTTTIAEYTIGDVLVIPNREGTEIFDRNNESAHSTTGICYGICGTTVRGHVTITNMIVVNCSEEGRNVDSSNTYETYEVGSTIHSVATTKKVSK